jgi:hypothetical protein
MIIIRKTKRPGDTLMKKRPLALVLLLIGGLHNAEAAEQTCSTLSAACRDFKNLDPSDTQACSKCLKICDEARKICAQAKEKFDDASVHHLYCKNECQKASKHGK